MFALTIDVAFAATATRASTMYAAHVPGIAGSTGEPAGVPVTTRMFCAFGVPSTAYAESVATAQMRSRRGFVGSAAGIVYGATASFSHGDDPSVAPGSTPFSTPYPAPTSTSIPAHPA